MTRATNSQNALDRQTVKQVIDWLESVSHRSSEVRRINILKAITAMDELSTDLLFTDEELIEARATVIHPVLPGQGWNTSQKWRPMVSSFRTPERRGTQEK